jgi:hypothetical protein
MFQYSFVVVFGGKDEDPRLFLFVEQEPCGIAPADPLLCFVAVPFPEPVLEREVQGSLF